MSVLVCSQYGDCFFLGPIVVFPGKKSVLKAEASVASGTLTCPAANEERSSVLPAKVRLRNWIPCESVDLGWLTLLSSDTSDSGELCCCNGELGSRFCNECPVFSTAGGAGRRSVGDGFTAGCCGTWSVPVSEDKRKTGISACVGGSISQDGRSVRGPAGAFCTVFGGISAPMDLASLVICEPLVDA